MPDPVQATTPAEECPAAWVDTITRDDEVCILDAIRAGNLCDDTVCVRADSPDCLCAIQFRAITGRSVGKEASDAG